MNKFFLSILSGLFALQAAANGAILPSKKPEKEKPQSVITLRDRALDDFLIAGAIDVRDKSDFEDNYVDDIGDGVFFAPGVSVNALDIQEPRLSIRGFAVGNTQQRSSVKVLRDGAPLTDIHGATHWTDVNLMTSERIAIDRGVVELATGGDNLGGVVNIIAKTGKTAQTGIAARLDGATTIDGKADGQVYAHTAANAGLIDYYAAVTGVYENGWRDNNRRRSQTFNGNIGFALRDNIQTRLYADVTNANTEIAGPLTLAQLSDNPQDPTLPIALGPLFPGGPIIELVDGARADDFARDIREARIANETSISLLGHDLEVAGHYARRDIENPQIDFVGFIDESGSEWGARIQFGRRLELFGAKAAYRAGVNYSKGGRDHDRFENAGGMRGDQLADTHQHSKQLSAFADGTFSLLRNLAIDFGAKLIKVERRVTDLSNDDVDIRDDTGVAARAGVTFALNEAMQVYVSANRGYEPASMGELTLTDPTELADLEEQDSFSLEAGLRGRVGQWLGFDVAYYDTDIENEIISLAEPNGFVNGQIYENAAKTSHKGIEAGLDIHLFPSIMASRDAALTLRNVYAYSDHRFIDAGSVDTFDNARIAGTPVHSYRGEVRYDANDTWFLAANIELAGGEYFVDHENTTSAPTDPVLGFSAGYKLTPRMEVFASGENILDQNYASGLSPVLTFNPDEDRIFTPGARATVYGGLKVRF